MDFSNHCTTINHPLTSETVKVLKTFISDMFGGTETLFVQTWNGTRHRQSRKHTYMCYAVVGLQVSLTVIRNVLVSQYGLNCIYLCSGGKVRCAVESYRRRCRTSVNISSYLNKTIIIEKKTLTK